MRNRIPGSFPDCSAARIRKYIVVRIIETMIIDHFKNSKIVHGNGPVAWVEIVSKMAEFNSAVISNINECRVVIHGQIMRRVDLENSTCADLDGTVDRHVIVAHLDI